MQRNRAFDCLKGFAILLVMLGHCIVLNGLNASDPYLYDAIKSIQMPLFMAVSGSLAGISFWRKKSGGALGEIIKKRALCYLTPFFSWFVLVYLVVNGMAGTLSFAGFVRELAALLKQTDRGLWFLMTLFVVTLVSALSQWAADRFGAIFYPLGCFLFYLLFFLQARTSFSFLSPSLTVLYMPYYVLAYLAFGYGRTLLERFPKEKQKRFFDVLTALGVLFLLLFLWMVIELDLTRPVEQFSVLCEQMAASFLGTCACFVLIYRAVTEFDSDGKKCCITRFFSFIGQYTLEIYVLHFRFARLLRLSEKGLVLYSVRGLGWLFAAFLLMAALTAVCIFLIRRLRPLSLLLFGK